jgi:hypothetical protein
LLRFFVRGTRKVNEDIEEAAGSDHEDGLSASNSQCSQCSLPDHLSPPSSAPLRFDRNIAAYVTMPRRKRRAEKRDSGFHSEVSSVATISSYCSGYCPIVSYLCITTHNILPLDQRILANRKETK